MVTLQLSSWPKEPTVRADNRSIVPNLSMRVFNNSINDIACHFFFCFKTKFPDPVFPVDNGDLIRIVTESGSLVVERIEYHEVKILSHQLRFCVGYFVFRLEGKTND